MGYWEDAQAVATAHRHEIEADVARLRRELSSVERQAAELTTQLDALNALLTLAKEPRREDSGQSSGRNMTLHDAMVEVLRATPMRMGRAVDLAAEVNRRGLYQMKDGRPVEPQQIHARVGRYRHLFEREDTFIKLVEG